MSKFKIGDMVRIISNGHCPFHGFEVGDITEIIKDNDSDAPYCRRINDKMEQYVNIRDFEPVTMCRKIVVTTDGKTTIAKLFSGKKMVKSAAAKCSPRDEFDFETGAALALDRLLDREQKTPKFTKTDLKDGMFGRLSDGSYFVIAAGRAVFDDGFFCLLSELSDDLRWAFAGSIDFLVDAANCFKDVPERAEAGRFIWRRPGVEI